MSEPITRDEMKAAMEVQSKNTEQMLSVVKSLERIIDTQVHILQLQEQLISKLTNGIKKEIAHEVSSEVKVLIEPTVNTVNKNCEMLVSRTPLINQISSDIEKVKWFVGIVGLIVITSSIFIKILTDTDLHQAQIKDEKHSTELLRQIKIHMEQVE